MLVILHIRGRLIVFAELIPTHTECTNFGVGLFPDDLVFHADHRLQIEEIDITVVRQTEEEGYPTEEETLRYHKELRQQTGAAAAEDSDTHGWKYMITIPIGEYTGTADPAPVIDSN